MVRSLAASSSSYTHITGSSSHSGFTSSGSDRRRRHRHLSSSRRKEGASSSMLKARKDRRSHHKRRHRECDWRRSSSDDDSYRKFAWLRSPSPSPSLRRPPPTAAAATALSDQQVVREAALVARERHRVQARLLNRSRSGARRALKGLQFISRTTIDADGGAALWRAVEERFNALATDGLLARDDFGDCIGMVDSKEFAVGIFVARRRRQNLERISKDELYEFWLQISDQSFDARLQIFFDMVDTNRGR